MKVLKRLVCATLSALVLFISCAPAFADVDALEKAQIQHTVPGVMAVVVKAGETVYKEALGSADVAVQRPMDAERTAVQMGSISKVFTAYALVTLAQEKGIDLDAPIGPYLPAYLKSRPYVSELTFRNLMTHSTGLAALKANSATEDNPLSQRIPFAAAARTFFDTYALEPVVSKDAYTIFSNVGYLLAGVLIESLSGMSYEQFMSEQVFRPLHMDTTAALVEGREVPGIHLVQNYAVFGGATTPQPSYKAVYLPSDDTVTTLEDMERFLIYLTGKGVPDAVSEALFTRQMSNSPYTPGRSFGFSSVKYGGHTVFVHDGSIPGENTRLMVFPESRVAVFLIFNSDNLTARDAFTRAALDGIVPLEDKGKSFPEYTGQNLEKFIGSYSPVNASEETIEKLSKVVRQIRVTHDKAVLKIAGTPYRPIAETLFYSDDLDTFAEFRTDATGHLQYLILGNAIYEATPFFKSVLTVASLFVLLITLALVCFIQALRAQLRSNRTSRSEGILVLHTVVLGVVVVLMFYVAGTYSMWNVIYGSENLFEIIGFLGKALAVLTVPAIVIMWRSSRVQRWGQRVFIPYRLYFVLTLGALFWMWRYHLI